MNNNYCKYVVKTGILLISCWILSLQPINAQNLSKLNLGVGHGYSMPFGDLGDRFGRSWKTTVGLYYHTYSRNYIFGVEGSLIFGNIVNEDILANLRDPDQPLLGINQTVSDIVLRQRGYSGYATVEKILTFGNDDITNSGIKIGVGLGFLSHFVRIQDNTNNNAYLKGSYIHGYNRYAFGPAAKQFIGYHLANQAFNYGLSIGVEIEEGFTSPRRAVDFSTGAPLPANRLDILTTLKAKFYLNLGTYGNVESIEY